MIAQVAVRWIAVLGLAVLGGCAGPGSGASRPPATPKPAATAQPPPAPAPAQAEPRVAQPATPPPEAAPSQPAPPALSVPSTPRSPLAQAPPARPITPPARPGRQIVLNFDNADIEAVIQAASEIAGFNYTIGPGVAGKKVTIQTSGRIPEDEVFNVLLAVLEVNGVTAVRSGNLYKIIPTPAARERPLPTVIGAQPDPTRRDDEIITQIVPLQYVPSERVAATLRPFVQGGNLVVQGNLLLVTDTAANVARILQILSVLDVEVATDDLRLIPVRYADAVELARMLNEFFSGRRVRTPSAPAPAPAPAPPRPGAPPAPAGVPGAVDSGERPPMILADKRTNALLVSGRRAEVDLAAKLAAQLDVDTQANKRVFVYYVENVKAKELAATLTEIFGKPGETGPSRPERQDQQGGIQGSAGQPPPAPSSPVVSVVATGTDLEPSVVEGQVKVVADEPNNALIVTTFPRNWPLIEDTIRKLDRTPKQVLIEVLVAEVGLNDENRLGLEWTLRTQRDVSINGTPYNVGSVSRVDVGPLSPLPGSQTAPTLGGAAAAAAGAAPATAGLSFLLFETDRFLGMLNLYANYGQLTVLSSPTIMTSENKKAVINVSNSVPIVTQQQVSASTGVGQTVPQQQQQVPSQVLTQSVEYRDAGIILTVTPRISDKRVVALDVKQTVNDVGDPRPPSLSPDIIKREAETSVVLRDNQTLVLGGLIRSRRTSTKQGIPWLSKIPVIGFLFGATVDRIERTELLLLITPRVIGDPSEGQEILQQVRGQRPGLERDLRLHPNILRPETEPAKP